MASSSQTGKVNIVTHSNGGLIAKALINKLKKLGKENLIDKKIWCEHFKEEFKLIDSDIDMYLSKKYYTENFLPCNMYNLPIVNPQFQLTVCRTRNGYTMSDTSNFTQEELDNYEYWKTPIDLK